MKQAKPSERDNETFLEFMQGIELIIEHGQMPDHDYEDGEARNDIDDRDVVRWLEHQWEHVGPVWQRVYWAGRMAIENACDPNSSILEWRDELKEAAERITQ